MKNILITGSKGFLGSSFTKYYNNKGYNIYGIGNGKITLEEQRKLGLYHWKQENINIESIKDFNTIFDVIIHCAGSGSVGFSEKNPLISFRKSVESSLQVLEFIRLYNPNAHLIFPSSPASQGEHEDLPIKESYVGYPISHYGFHKKIVEELCKNYHKKYDLKISIIRFFSIYGNGLKKQLIWDAVKKIKNENKEAIFFGTGNEIRDFIHISDVLRLVSILLKKKNKFTIINGGTGKKHTIQNIVSMVQKIINPNVILKFNNQTKNGDPKYYCADIEQLTEFGFKSKINLQDGIIDYINWIKNND